MDVIEGANDDVMDLVTVDAPVMADAGGEVTMVTPLVNTTTVDNTGTYSGLLVFRWWHS